MSNKKVRLIPLEEWRNYRIDNLNEPEFAEMRKEANKKKKTDDLMNNFFEEFKPNAKEKANENQKER